MHPIVALITALSAVPSGDRAPEALAAIDEILTPQDVVAPGFPYRAADRKDLPVSGVRLRNVSVEKNGITDHEEWFRAHDLEQPRGPLDPGSEEVPAETRWGGLAFFRVGTDLRVAVYAKVGPRAKADGLDRWDAEVYTEEYDYTVVVFDAGPVPVKVLRLAAFHPGILEMSHAELVDRVLYFDCNYNGYASIMKEKTGYLVALDLAEGRVLWSTKALTASWWGFVVRGEVLVAGYGFTAEPDFLYLLDRGTGRVLQTVKIRTAHETLIPRGDLLYVRTYDHDYVFRFEEGARR